MDIKPGDRVAVDMTDGRQERFRVQSVDGDALVSPTGQRYERAQMLRLRRQQFSHAKTWPLTAAGIFVSLVIYVAATWGF